LRQQEFERGSSNTIIPGNLTSNSLGQRLLLILALLITIDIAI
jgi:hypothetical protein